jgi:ADP-ribose pyrophosphatase YjhB (NUDIX family)
MASSNFHTTQYDAENFVESVGAIAIKRSTREICLIRHEKRGEWLLAKGRRNAGESRHNAALREIQEETGFACHMLPLTMTTRAPPAIEEGHYPDKPRVHQEATEPFMLTCRQLDEGKNMKIIWWYIAAIDEDAEVENGETQFGARLVNFSEAADLLTFEQDRDIVRKAIGIFEGSQTSSTTA